jgi:hypothetical protein
MGPCPCLAITHWQSLIIDTRLVLQLACNTFSELINFRDNVVAVDPRVGKRCVPTITNALMTAQAATDEPINVSHSHIEDYYESIDCLVSHMMHPIRGIPLFQKYVYPTDDNSD